MSSRRWSAPARLAAGLLLLAGVASAADPPAVAPPPREAKSKPVKSKIDPDLLVGRWRLIHDSFREIPPGEVSTREYRKDGRYRFETQSPSEPRWSQEGTYVLRGNALELRSDAAIDGYDRTRLVTILSITSDRLEITIKGQRSKFVRSPAR